MVIKPDSFVDEPGFNYELTYLDNPQISLPSSVVNWVTTTGTFGLSSNSHLKRSFIQKFVGGGGGGGGGGGQLWFVVLVYTVYIAGNFRGIQFSRLTGKLRKLNPRNKAYKPHILATRNVHPRNIHREIFAYCLSAKIGSLEHFRLYIRYRHKRIVGWGGGVVETEYNNDVMTLHMYIYHNIYHNVCSSY